jgi:hypothetical protein
MTELLRILQLDAQVMNDEEFVQRIVTEVKNVSSVPCHLECIVRPSHLSFDRWMYFALSVYPANHPFALVYHVPDFNFTVQMTRATSSSIDEALAFRLAAHPKCHVLRKTSCQRDVWAEDCKHAFLDAASEDEMNEKLQLRGMQNILCLPFEETLQSIFQNVTLGTFPCAYMARTKNWSDAADWIYLYVTEGWVDE